jgi:hypothetical protein
MRSLLAWIISPVMRITGYRFSKHFRWGTTCCHRLVYKCVDTVMANHFAEGMSYIQWLEDCRANRQAMTWLKNNQER